MWALGVRSRHLATKVAVEQAATAEVVSRRMGKRYSSGGGGGGGGASIGVHDAALAAAAAAICIGRRDGDVWLLRASRKRRWKGC